MFDLDRAEVAAHVSILDPADGFIDASRYASDGALRVTGRDGLEDCRDFRSKVFFEPAFGALERVRRGDLFRRLLGDLFRGRLVGHISSHLGRLFRDRLALCLGLCGDFGGILGRNLFGHCFRHVFCRCVLGNDRFAIRRRVGARGFGNAHSEIAGIERILHVKLVLRFTYIHFGDLQRKGREIPGRKMKNRPKAALLFILSISWSHENDHGAEGIRYLVEHCHNVSRQPRGGRITCRHVLRTRADCYGRA